MMMMVHSRRVMIAALLLEMIRYKLAWLLFIYQRVLCVKFAVSDRELSE